MFWVQSNTVKCNSKNCIGIFWSKIHPLCPLLYRIIWKLSSFESVLMYYETLKGYLLTVLKSAPGQNSKCFCLKALEIPLRKISISCRRKLLSQQERYTQLDWIQEIFLRWYFYFCSFWRRWNEWGLNWAERLHIFCTYKCTIF